MNQESNVDDDLKPTGELCLRLTALSKDTNGYGDIYGGWLMQQMDLAGSVLAEETAEGRVVTAAVQAINFLRPVPLGANVSCYCDLVAIGHASVEINVEAWVTSRGKSPFQQKVADGRFYFVAISDQGKTRRIPR